MASKANSGKVSNAQALDSPLASPRHKSVSQARFSEQAFRREDSSSTSEEDEANATVVESQDDPLLSMTASFVQRPKNDSSPEASKVQNRRRSTAILPGGMREDAEKIEVLSATSFEDDCVIIEDDSVSEHWAVARRFGFPCSMSGSVMEAETQFYPQLMQQSQLCETKWNLALQGVQLLANALPDQIEPLRKSSRKYGIPIHFRSVVWLTLSGTALKVEENAGYYTALRGMGYVTGEPEDTIRKDLERTFPDHPHFNKIDRIGSLQLKHVLHALCWRNPVLNYCQSFNFLVAILLLILDDEESSFWMMVHILENLLPNDYYGEGLMGLKVDQEVALHLLWDHVPKLAAHFENVMFDVRALLPAWVMSLYVNIFPIETTVRVWDHLLTWDCRQGRPPAVLTILIGFLKLHEAELLRMGDSSEILMKLGSMAAAQFDATKLIKTAHELRVTANTVHSLRRSKKGTIVAEQKQRKEQKEARMAARARKEREQEEAAAASQRDSESNSTVMSPNVRKPESIAESPTSPEVPAQAASVSSLRASSSSQPTLRSFADPQPTDAVVEMKDM